MYRLMVITDRRACAKPLTETVQRALDGGADAVQLRERDLHAAELIRLAETLRRATDRAHAALIINHRLDVALAVGADGVHLGWRSLRPQQARRLAGSRLRIGVSCHSGRQLRAAQSAGADYALLGPVFFTPSKRGLVRPLGLDTFRTAASASAIPVIAIGGITPHNASAVRRAGASGIAVISAVMTAPDPARAATALLAAHNHTG